MNNNSSFLTVSQLSEQLSELFSAPIFSNIVVLGEVTTKVMRKGTVYSNLSDVDENGKVKASISVVVFSSVLNYSYNFNIGDKVLIRGRLNYYEPSGSLSFIANKIEAYGQGNEAARIREIYERLKKQGIFDQERKRPIPRFPKKIGIVTSSEGAAYHDIIETLSHRFPVNTILFDAKVQGNNGPSEIVKALNKAYSQNDIDVIILGRGGGSKADLMPFNDEKVVLTVSQSPVPIITAIGHEIDTSLADYASDLQAITPTAAASHAVIGLDEFESELASYEEQLYNNISYKIDSKYMDLISVENELTNKSPLVKLNLKQTDLVYKEQQLNIKIEKRFNSLALDLGEKHKKLISLNPIKNIDELIKLSENKLRLLQISIDHKVETYFKWLGEVDSKLNLLNPLKILEKGYAIVYKDDSVIDSVNNININDNISIKLYDGNIVAQVKELNKNGK